MADDWTIRDGAVYWRGRFWSKPDRLVGKDDPTQQDLEDHVERLRHRYPGEIPGVLLGPPDEERPKRTKGGPWRYTLPDGTTAVIHTSRKQDAKAVLRHELQRKRLPKGTTWEIEL